MIRDLAELLQLHMNTVGGVREAFVESIFGTCRSSIAQGLNAIYLNTFAAECLEFAIPVNILQFLAPILFMRARALVTYNYKYLDGILLPLQTIGCL